MTRVPYDGGSSRRMARRLLRRAKAWIEERDVRIDYHIVEES
jgi:hypothetical protein